MSHEKILNLAVRFRFLRIPTHWSIETNEQGERLAVPRVEEFPRKIVMGEIDGWELRRSFLQLKDGNAKTVFSFLQQVGVWELKDPRVRNSRPEEPAQFLNGYFGSRLLRGEILKVRRDHLQKTAQWWNDALLDRAALKKRFGSPPVAASEEIHKYIYAWQTATFNELPMHIEWDSGRPFAVVETVTGWEMIIATIHLDLLRGARFGICKRKDCGISFPKLSKHEKKYCSVKCAHLVAVRKSRKPKGKTQNNGGHSGNF
jgi:hypothetical protein